MAEEIFYVDDEPAPTVTQPPKRSRKRKTPDHPDLTQKMKKKRYKKKARKRKKENVGLRQFIIDQDKHLAEISKYAENVASVADEQEAYIRQLNESRMPGTVKRGYREPVVGRFSGYRTPKSVFIHFPAPIQRTSR